MFHKFGLKIWEKRWRYEIGFPTHQTKKKHFLITVPSSFYIRDIGGINRAH